MQFTEDLKREYETLFATCVVRPERAEDVEHAIDQILRGKDQYEAVGDPLGIPWYVIGAIHWRECDARFDCHLHNGDSLQHRTVNVPSGRPTSGEPPFTWAESAKDALVYEGFDEWKDWSIAGTLFVLEKYNGFGARAKGIHSGYLWSGSNQYSSGKYIADHLWSKGAVDKQVGAAVIIKRLFEQNLAAAQQAASLSNP